jgi:hypothetical protein
MDSITWRLRTGDTEEYIYRLQCKDVAVKSETRLFEIMKDWLLAGEAWPTKDNSKEYIFQKQFKSEEEFSKWIKTEFPWNVKLLPSTSETVKKIKKVSKVKKAKRGRPKKRKPTQCKKCGGIGHNVRSCGR